MTTQISPKVRFVRCPKCREVLTESPELPLYKCGGCGTILQANPRRNQVSNSESSHIPNENEASSSVLDSSPSGGPDGGRPSDQGDNGDNDREQCEDRRSSDELSHVHEVSDRDLDRDNEVIAPQIAEQSRHAKEGKCILAEDNEKGPNLRGQVEGQLEEMDCNGRNPLSSEIVGDCSANEKNTSVNHLSLDTEKLNLSHTEDRRSFGRMNSEDALDSSLPDDPRTCVDMSKSPTIKSHYAYEKNKKNKSVNPLSPDTEKLNLSHTEDRRSSGRMSSVDTLDSSLPDDPRTCVDMSKSPTIKSHYAYEKNEKNASVNPLSPDTEKLNLSHTEDIRSFGRMSSVDTLDSSLPDDPRTRVDMSKSPTIKSHYAYEGSVSSYDGNDDQVPDHFSRPPRRKFKDKVSTELHKKDWLSKTASSSSSGLQGRQYPAMEGSSKWHQVELPETRRHGGFKSGNRTRFDKVEEASRTPSSYQRISLQNRQVCRSLDRPTYSELDRTDLLRMVLELKDQLNRMQLSKMTANGMSFSGGLSRGGPQWHQRSRMAFSGEAAHYSHQHCYSPRSAQLSSHSMLCNNGHHCNFHASSSASPQHYMKSDMKRFYLCEKHHVTKRHLRPIFGGAPLISCHHCSVLLQLPSDCLLFKKRHHQLRCNSCWKVLKFSLLGGHVVPYLPEASAPPPSEADDYNDVNNHRNTFPHAEPVSCSDDYGPSFCRSCSTEGDAFLEPSDDRLERKGYNRKISSGSSCGQIEDRKMKSVVVENSIPAGDSSKMAKWRNASSEIEEVIERSNSPLHRLMGYTSPSQVLDK